ncbi:MAG: UDP-3-O-(3-hydroxymyristoyl)glucosamine N-acyltransferase [Lewinellaceae bacterium]|jgi:UDP-3-O-[3-hydroxymyristoyl] glucosamine N-acyltransferase|nr:UDP-3-O-(3-hydroxymyristoyl)glucosamine N-acyltransferase [Lewinellaceae bacterium]
MKFTAAQLAQLLNGSLEGDPDVIVSRAARIEEAGEGDFAFLDNSKYEPFIYKTKASVLLVGKTFQPAHPVKPTLVKVENVRDSLAYLLQLVDKVNHSNGAEASGEVSVHASAKVGVGTTIGTYSVIEEGAVIGNNCIIYPQVFIGRNVHIGDNCLLFPGVRIHFDCVVGDNCTIHANAVIGADGFGFAPQDDNSWKKVPQVGNVILENNVEIGACTCVDRAAIGSTVIRQGAKLDNLIHIAHNAEVGKNTALAAQAGVAGSTRIGENCQIGGQVGFAGHLTIADGTRIQAQSGLSSNVTKPNTALFGSPAIGYKDFIRSHVVFKQLPDLQKKVLELEKRLKALEGE